MTDVFPESPPKSGEEVRIQGVNGLFRAYLAQVDAGDRRDLYLLPLPNAAASDLNLVADFQTMPVALIMFEPSGAVCAINLAAREVIGALATDATLMFQDLF